MMAAAAAAAPMTRGCARGFVSVGDSVTAGDPVMADDPVTAGDW